MTFLSTPALTRLASTFARASTASQPFTASFATAGLPPPLVHALQTAFPHVRAPLPFQASLIRAVLADHNVLLKGKTGRGKSFAIALAVLAQAFARPRPASTLILVPHRDLAAQYSFWLTTLLTAASKLAPSYPSTSQPPPLPITPSQITLLARGYETATPSSSSTDTHPRIVVSTPTALLDSFELDQVHATFSTAVVDELDALVDYVPARATKNELRRLQTREKNHPAPVGKVLDALAGGGFGAQAQVVLCAATFAPELVDRVEERGWIAGSRKVSRIEVGKAEGHRAVVVDDEHAGGEDQKEVGWKKRVLYHALVVGADGVVRNHPMVVKNKPLPTEEKGAEEEITEEQRFAIEQLVYETQDPDIKADDIPLDVLKKFADTPSPFHPGALEAIAELFALQVRHRALLVLPSELSVRRCIWDLRRLGVEARALDVRADTAKLFLPARDGAEAELIVSTEASTRGLDVFGLSHVFVYGVPTGYKRASQYIHLAGRVARLGRGSTRGTVVSVVKEPKGEPAEMAREAKVNERLVGVNEVKALGEIYTALGIRPTRNDLFG